MDDRGAEPIIRTGYPYYSAPSNGAVTLSLGQTKEDRKDLTLITDISSIPSNDYAGLIVSFSEKAFDTHDFMFLARRPSALVDDRYNPQITIQKHLGQVKFANGEIIKEGEKITIDPQTGRIWRGKLPILPPDKNSLKLMEHLSTLVMHSEDIKVATHAHDQESFRSIFALNETSEIDIPLGLYRTENLCQDYLQEAMRFFHSSALKDGSFSIFLGFVKYTGTHFNKTNYRLPDLHNLRGRLDDFHEALDRGEDHNQGTDLFELRKALYRHQLKYEIPRIIILPEAHANIIIPSVETPEEVAYFKKLVYEILHEVTPEKYKKNIGFGVMMETEKALENTAAIAKQCDCLCYGTNDLTAAILKLPRGEQDYSDWMEKHGHKGRSPFEVLVPEVLEKLEKSIKEARTANPDIKINICGHQVAGHDIDSILAVLKMGVDMITVPPTEEHFNRARLSVAQHESRLKIEMKPPSAPALEVPER